MVIAGLAIVALVAGAVILIASGILPAKLGFSVDATSAYVRSWGAAAGLVIAVLMVLHTFLPFPAEILAFAAGHSLGWLSGTIWIWCGAMLGASVAFALARKFGRPFVERLVGERRAASLDEAAERYANAGSLVAVRFVPVISFNLVNFAAGLTTIGWFTFLWTTAVGILPLTIFMVVMGERMRQPDWLDLALFCVVAIGLSAWSIARARKARR